MYIQYETKEGEYYCLDLFEKPLNMLLFSYSWIKPMKLYKTDKKYSQTTNDETRKRRTRLQPFAIISGMFLYKVFDIETGVLFYLNYQQSIVFYVLTFIPVLFILYFICKYRRNKMEKVSKINRYESIEVNYYPNSFIIKIFLMIAYPLLIVYFMIFAIKILRDPNDSTILLVFFLNYLILNSSYFSIILCSPKYGNKKFKRIIL